MPTDKIGAEFGANYFDPDSNLTLGEQIEKYFNDVLIAVNPNEAPNYIDLPDTDSQKQPGATNSSTTPMFTLESK